MTLKTNSAFSNKKMKIMNEATNLSLKSSLNNRYGVIITKGSRIISKGFNTDRSYLEGNSICSLHAEVSAMKNLSRISLEFRQCLLRE